MLLLEKYSDLGHISRVKLWWFGWVGENPAGYEVFM